MIEMSIQQRIILIVVAFTFTVGCTFYTYPPKALRDRFKRIRRKK